LHFVEGGLSLRHALLGFVALYPTYILMAVLPNAKPTTADFAEIV
jgi:hypothetical protein